MKKKKSKKPIIIIVSVAVLLVAALVTGLLLTSNNSADAVTVMSVKEICSSGASSGIGNVYSGSVESQKTVNINADANYTIAETYVKVGSTVKNGDKLFTYDMSQNEISQKQAQLDIDKLNNNGLALQEELYQLMEEREEASSSQKDDYSVQILQKQNEIKQNAFDIEAKQLELSNLKEEAKEATVTSPISGVVRTLNDISSSDSKVYMTIMATGDYRIQGVINENNIDDIKLGDRVIIHSRTDETKLWYGTISEIDKENPVYKNAESATASTDYAFYVTLSSTDGLMLGEHIYIEKDLGLTADGKIQLPAYYILDAQTSPHVLADNGGKIEKRDIELGQLNESTNCYVVTSGLGLDDYIAYPDANVKVGSATKKESSK